MSEYICPYGKIMQNHNIILLHIYAQHVRHMYIGASTNNVKSGFECPEIHF